LLLDTLVQSGGSVPAPADIDKPLGPLDQPWLLLASVAMFAISFFLLHQAVAFQEWVTAKDEAAPNPRAGVGLAWALSLALVLFSVIYWLVRHPPHPGDPGPEAFRWFMSNRPSELAIDPCWAVSFQPQLRYSSSLRRASSCVVPVKTCLRCLAHQSRPS